MTDTNTSGVPDAPAADTPAPAAPAETLAASFGGTRGSGLLRGKRPSGASAPAAKTVASNYKPTTIEIITPAREYKNPFASPEPENAPAAEPAKIDEPVAVAAAPQETAAPQEAVAAPQPVSEEPAPAAAAPAPAEPAPADEPEEKQQIQILPPAESFRPAVRWESSSSRDERPTFRADRREDAAPAQNREPRQPRDPRDERPRYESRQPRDPRDERPRYDPRQPRDPRDEEPRQDAPRHAEPAPAPKGFFAWLKGLFGGPKAPEAPAAGQGEAPSDSFGGGQRHRRRHRGGRGGGGGGGGNPQGFRGDRQQPQGGREFENRGGERGGGRRRRHRGGSGRDRGGNPRSEGHQGGGAI